MGEESLEVIASRVARLEADVRDLDQVKADIKVLDVQRAADVTALQLAATHLDERLGLLPGQYATRELHDTLERRVALLETTVAQGASEGQGIRSTGKAIAIGIAAVASGIGIIVAVNHALAPTTTIEERAPSTVTVTVPAR